MAIPYSDEKAQTVKAFVDRFADAFAWKRRGGRTLVLTNPDDVKILLDLLLQTGAEAYLHQGCGCEWGSRGERAWNPRCTVDALLARLRAA